MTRETRVIVYSEGAFDDQPAPGWYREAEELEAGGLDWQKALSRVLGTDHDQYAELLGDVGIEIRVWRSTGLGTYVETGDCIRTWDAVWVPLPSDSFPGALPSAAHCERQQSRHRREAQPYRQCADRLHATW